MLTRILIGINVVVYLWELSTGALNSDQALIDHGAMWGPAIAAGQWWRIVTGSFLHANIYHIGFNMLALWQVGTFAEIIFGAPRMLLLYLLSMAGGGWAIYTFTYSEVTVGASGAIFGVFGALGAAGVRMGPRGRGLWQQTVGIIILNLVWGYFQPNISMAGHIGGLVCGVIAGYLLVPRRILHPAPSHAAHYPQASEPETIEGEVLYDSAHDHKSP